MQKVDEWKEIDIYLVRSSFLFLKSGLNEENGFNLD